MLLAATCCLMVLVVEMGLRVLTPFPVTDSSNKKSHPELVYTLDPDLPDVDASGFRNDRWTLDQADLAVIGDSHTYGVNVTAERSFPAVLAARTGRKVYNLGVSSYGIYQYGFLIDEAIESGVEDIVVGFYPANDLALNCQVLKTGYWRTEARTRGMTLPGCEGPADNGEPSAFSLGALKSSLVNTATVQAFQELVLKPIAGTAKPSDSDYFLFEGDQAVSRKRVKGHARAASLDEADIRMNVDNSQAIFLRGSASATDASIGFSIVILPSKERVLHAWAERRGQPVDDAFDRMVQNERKLVQAYETFFGANGIAYSDALPDVVAAFERVLEAGGAFYPVGNGHPFEDGYAAYAEAALRALEDGQERLRLTKARPAA